MFDVVNLVQTFGYLGVTAIVFAESGLFFAFFLPGDSLLFTAGILASQGIFSIWILVALTTLAAILGNSFGYWFGTKIGPKLFFHDDSFFFKKERILQSQKFFEHYGSASIVLARFIPGARTFIPILAGVASMRYSTFLFYNVLGSILWAFLIPVLGYFLGSRIPHIERYIIPVVLIIVLVSLYPVIRELIAKFGK